MNWRYPQSRILVFARAPVKGRVKTRLIPALGPAGALALYEKLLGHTLETVRHSRLAPAVLCCSPDLQHEFFRQHSKDFVLYQQQGQDLGERMERAICHGLQEAQAVVLIGSDCPAIDATCLARAFDALTEHDVVIGPAEDGGYVLIGMKRPRSGLFENIDWGSDRVLAQTRERLETLGLSWAELPALPDIDRPEDLKHLPKEKKERYKMKATR